MWGGGSEATLLGKEEGGLGSAGGGHPSLRIRQSFCHRPVGRAGPGLGRLEGAGAGTQVPALLPAPRPLAGLAWAPTSPRQRHRGSLE